MSTHSYCRLWIHLIWETLAREPMLNKRAAAEASIHLSDYAVEKGIYMKINYFNADHTHALFDLPTGKSIEQVVQLFKGDSSHWINENKLIQGKFAWDVDMGPSQCLTLTSREGLHCASRGAPQEKDLCGRVRTFRQTVWLEMARRGKPLKRLES